MIRYFVCETCRRGFEAEDSPNTVCPFCNSDNIRPARKPSGIMKIVPCVLTFIIFCVIGVILPIDLKKDKDTAATDAVESVYQTETTSSAVMAESIDSTKIPRIVDISTPIMKGENYSFHVTVEILSGDKVRLSLMEEFGDTPLYLSNDGNFSDVMPVKNGVYKLVAENIKTGDLSEVAFVNGCLPVQKIQPLSSSEMQATFNTGEIPSKAYLGNFAPNLKITVNGTDSSEPKVGRVEEIFNRIGSAIWTSVKVSDVTYANDNRVNALTITVTY